MTSSLRVPACLALALVASITYRTMTAAQQGQGQTQGQGQAQTQGGGQASGRGGGGRGAGAAGAPAPSAAEVIPTTASSLVARPDLYLGKVITITGSLQRQITNTVFTVGQNRSAAQGEVLVIAPTLVQKPAAQSYVTVVGDAFAFDSSVASAKLKGAALDVPADVAAAFRGKPAIIATAVVTPDFTDLTKAKPAPMTPDDLKLSPLMKTISPAATALRTAATGSDAATARAKSAELKQAFTDALVVFKARNMTDAVNWAGDALKAIDTADSAAAATHFTDVTAAAATLQQTCTACHTAHRDRLDDGSYRIK